ncbi:hypothetical protein EES42_34400 [Streptomyces sp. ADI95-17]|nr:hypothetical protein EES42_34400 [Streptomyces sp. ADI95-17]
MNHAPRLRHRDAQRLNHPAPPRCIPRSPYTAAARPARIQHPPPSPPDRSAPGRPPRPAPDAATVQVTDAGFSPSRRRSAASGRAFTVADRALRAAEDANDPIRIAVAHWDLGHVLLLRLGQEANAAHIAMAATDQLDRTPGAIAARTVLEFVTAVTEAHSRRPRAARERPSEKAALLADQVSEKGNTLWSAFAFLTPRPASRERCPATPCPGRRRRPGACARCGRRPDADPRRTAAPPAAPSRPGS